MLIRTVGSSRSSYRPLQLFFYVITYTEKSVCIFYLIDQHTKFLLHNLQLLYMHTTYLATGLLQFIVGGLTVVINNTLQIGEYEYFLFSRTAHKFFVTYLTDALYMNPL